MTSGLHSRQIHGVDIYIFLYINIIRSDVYTHTVLQYTSMYI
jgi:hypothetical protein